MTQTKNIKVPKTMTNDTQAPESHNLKASFEPMYKMIKIFKKIITFGGFIFKKG